MTEIVQFHDFVELDYTGTLNDGTLFDTTSENEAKKNHLHSEKRSFGPVTICVGEKQLLPGLDTQLVGKEIGKEYTISLNPEDAFGKRDIKKLRIVPMGTFKEHNVQPHPGMPIDVDGERGIVTRVASGRVIVNFNHPLSGQQVQYTFTVRRKILDAKSQITAFLTTVFGIPDGKLDVNVAEHKATVKVPFDFPPPVTDALSKKLAELTKLSSVEFVKG